MSQRIVVKSFADLALVLNLEDLPADPAGQASSSPVTSTVTDGAPTDLARLLAELEAASATLVEMTRRDQEQRASALRDLEQYDALVAAQREAEQARDRAQQVRVQAEALAEAGFTDEARATAARVVESAHQAETMAAGLVEQRRHEAERLAARLDLERLLAERRRQEEAERARQEAAERTQRVAEAVEAARVALEAGRLAEARETLEVVAADGVDDPAVASLRQRVEQREFAVCVARAENAVWEARRLYRRDPASAVTCLEALDIEGLPEPLARQVFGTWARACLRLCHERDIADPLRYAPDPGRGAVIARVHETRAYVVISALGMGDGWRVGASVSERVAERARPLR